MERTKGIIVNQSNKTELEKLLTTLNNVGRFIPGCEELRGSYQDFWTPMYKDDPEAILEIKKVIRKAIRQWLINTNPTEIFETLHPIRMTAKFRPFLSSVKELVPQRYKGFFESDYKGLPCDFAVPTPFLVMEKTGKNVELSAPLIRTYGQTKIEIRGTILRAEDGQLTAGLLLLMRAKKLDISEKIISFNTTREEIAEILGKKYPRSESARESIWSGLTRLNDCRMTLTNAKGLRSLGGILSGAKELAEDSNFEIRIHLDRDFVNLIDDGYTSINPKIYFGLPPIQANLYLYLNRQRSFNTFGKLNPVNILKIYQYAGLGGINSDNQTNSYKRYTINKALEKLKDSGIIKEFTIKNDLLQINLKSEEATERKSLQEVANECENKSKDTCPYGHIFLTDYWNFKECKNNTCDLDVECCG